jgi:hypothetical protein
VHDVGIVERDQRDAATLEWPEGVDRVGHGDIGPPTGDDRRELASVAAKDGGEILHGSQRAADADAAILDAVVQRLDLVQARYSGHGLEVPKPVSRRDDLHFYAELDEAPDDGMAAGRVAESQPVHEAENSRARHEARCSRTANENGKTGTIVSTRQPERAARSARRTGSIRWMRKPWAR